MKRYSMNMIQALSTETGSAQVTVYGFHGTFYVAVGHFDAVDYYEIFDTEADALSFAGKKFVDLTERM